MEATRRRWRPEPAPVYAGPAYRITVLVLFLVNAALYVAVVGIH